MEFEKDDSYRDLGGLHDKCRKCMFYHVKLTMTDGRTIDGIIENVDADRVIALIGEDVMEQDHENEANMQRQYYNYGGPRRFRRFRRQAFPLATLAALSLLPYPYLAPPYPYYPAYPYFNYY